MIRRVPATMTLLLLAAVALVAMGPASGSSELASFEEHVKLGRRHLQEFEFGSALASFELVVEAYDRRELDLETPGARRLLTLAYEGMAEAHLGIGNADAAAGHFSDALAVHPAYEPDRDRHSPKLIDIFDQVRESRIGYLDVNVRPFGATVEINGKPAGETPLLSVPWPEGMLSIRVEHPGRASLVSRIHLEAGGRLSLEEELTANARTVSFVTAPTGVTIFVDGREAGMTMGPGSPALARENGLHVDAVSAAIVVENLSPGPHSVRFESNCYVTHEMQLEVVLEPGARRLDVPLVILEPSVATLNIQSSPWDGRVKVDGEDLGRTPVKGLRVCSGRHEVEVVGTPRGRWSAEIELNAGDTRTLEVSLRPTLVFLGLAAGPDVADEMMESARNQMQDAVGRLSRYHRVTPDREEGLGEGRALLPQADGSAPTVDLETVRNAAHRFGADLLLVGQVRIEKLRPVVDLALYSTLHETPDMVHMNLYESEPLERFIASLGERARLEHLWLGVRVAETRVHAHPVVVELYPGSPAAEAGVRVGDQVAAINETSVGSAVEWKEALALLENSGDSQAANTFSLTVMQKTGEQQRFELTAPWAPSIMQPGLPDALYNQRLVDLEYVAAGRGDDYSRGITRLNQAVAFIHFGRYDLALQKSLAQARLPEGQGISQSTVEYLRAWCYSRLGEQYRPEALAAFEGAANDDGATLATHQGPEVAPLAGLHLSGLR